jgi:Arc/MetJ-type ribon-helix-helix transcriptional regulator
MVMARTQTLVQLSDELLAHLDARVARDGRSRSELIREAVASYLADDLDAEIDRRIVASYSRQPQEDLLGADATALAMIAAEPWETPPLGRSDGADEGTRAAGDAVPRS